MRRKLEAAVRHYELHRRSNLNDDLSKFGRGELDPLKWAAGAYGKHLHQYHLKREDMKTAADALRKRRRELNDAKDFEAILKIVEEERVKGLGELYCYDTALRIGATRNISPEEVYLHRGTRTGAKKLNLSKPGQRSLPVSEVFEKFHALKRLEPHEIEDMLCIYKNFFLGKCSLSRCGSRGRGRTYSGRC